jgi:hypothetical protein
MQVMTNLVQVSPSKQRGKPDVPFSSGKVKASRQMPVKDMFDSISQRRSMRDKDYSRLSINAKKYSARMESARQASASFMEMKKNRQREHLHEYIHRNQSMEKPIGHTHVEIPAFEINSKPLKKKAPKLALEESDERLVIKIERDIQFNRENHSDSPENSINLNRDKVSHNIANHFRKEESAISIKRKVDFEKDPASVIFNESMI